MSDFADGIRKAVRAARESAKQHRDRQRRREEEESGRQEQNRRRARELRGPMWDRIRDAEEAGDGAIKAHRKSGVALTTFQLLWCRACGGEHAWDYFGGQRMVAGVDGWTAPGSPRGRDAGPDEGRRPAGTVREVLETRGRTLYYVVYDRTAREGPVPLVGETAGEFAVYTTADTFHVLP